MALAGLLAHLTDGSLDVREEVQDMAIGVDLDGFSLFPLSTGRTVKLDRTPRRCGLGNVVTAARVEYNGSGDMLEQFLPEA